MTACPFKQFSLQKQPRLHDAATAAQGKQSKRHAPLIPEFHHFVRQAASAPLAKNTKLLAPHLGGTMREEPDSVDGNGMEVQGEIAGKFVKVGVYHTPKQFLSLARQTLHPMDTTDHLEEVTRFALNFNLQYPPHLIKLERKKNLLQARLLALQCEEQERELHKV